jgi:hypothetical protein
MHFGFLALAVAGLLTLAQNTAAQSQFKYPAAPTSNQADDYNGVKVADPYRPLENPDWPESRVWIEAENKITFESKPKPVTALASLQRKSSRKPPISGRSSSRNSG